MNTKSGTGNISENNFSDVIEIGSGGQSYRTIYRLSNNTELIKDGKTVTTGKDVVLLQKCSANSSVALEAQKKLQAAVLADTSPNQATQTTGSSNQTSNNKNNFLIGMCSVSSYQKGDPPLDGCSKTQLVNRDIWATGGIIFRPNTTATFFISGAKAPPSSKTEQIFEFPVNYSIISATEIVTTISAKGGCIVKEKYTKIGGDVFAESLPSSGTCDQSQLRANQESVKMGRSRFEMVSDSERTTNMPMQRRQ
jgi:hypothetical protein